MAENGNGNGNGNARWQWFMSLLTASAVIVGALLTYFVQNASLTTMVSIDQARIVTLEQQQHTQDEKAGVMLAEIATMRSELKQTEGQFCSADHIRNLMHAYDLRMMAMMWQRMYPKALFPTDNAYYPNNCKS